MARAKSDLSPTADVDPLLDFVNRWNEGLRWYAALPEEKCEAFYDRVVQPFGHAATLGEFPDATTAKGAAAALRKVIDEGDCGGSDVNLIRAAIAYLDSEPTDRPTPESAKSGASWRHLSDLEKRLGDCRIQSNALFVMTDYFFGGQEVAHKGDDIFQICTTDATMLAEHAGRLQLMSNEADREFQALFLALKDEAGR